PCLERLESEVEHVLLGAEVVEHGRLGDLRVARDLGYGHSVEPAIGEQPPGGVGDELPSPLLLQLTQSHIRRHEIRGRDNLMVTLMFDSLEPAYFWEIDERTTRHPRRPDQPTAGPRRAVKTEATQCA